MDLVINVLDLVGTAVFAITGALVAGRKRMDIFGVVVLGCVTAVGGGTLLRLAALRWNLGLPLFRLEKGGTKRTKGWQ